MHIIKVIAPYFVFFLLNPLFIWSCLQMAEEEETREVLFPDWEGPDKTGLTIEQTTEGEIFVKEVKGESPAARSGKVYEGSNFFFCGNRQLFNFYQVFK